MVITNLFNDSLNICIQPKSKNKDLFIQPTVKLTERIIIKLHEIIVVLMYSGSSRIP